MINLICVIFPLNYMNGARVMNTQSRFKCVMESYDVELMRRLLFNLKEHSQHHMSILIYYQHFDDVFSLMTTINVKWYLGFKLSMATKFNKYALIEFAGRYKLVCITSLSQFLEIHDGKWSNFNVKYISIQWIFAMEIFLTKKLSIILRNSKKISRIYF